MGGTPVSAEVQSRATSLTKTTSQSRNLWSAYLGAFWENTIIEGRRIKEWEKHFVVTPLSNGIPLTKMTPDQVNEYTTLLIRKNNEAYYYYNKLSTACLHLEDVLGAELKERVRARVEWYRSSDEAIDPATGRRQRCPAKDTLVAMAEAEMSEDFAALRRAKVEVHFFETIINGIKAAMYQISNICTANAHEIRIATHE